MQKQETINIVWLKRDLRLMDNESIFNAIQESERFLLVYAFEPLLLNDPHYSERHFNFIKQSLVDLNHRLARFESKVLIVESEIIAAFKKILTIYSIKKVFSHQETGILVTYDRDKEFARFCRNNLIEWNECINNGVRRGLKNRREWYENWTHYMHQEIFPFDPKHKQLIDAKDIDELENNFKLPNINTVYDQNFQRGGTTIAWKYAQTFFEGRHENYIVNISKPLASRLSCSRLSPYLAWGNVSVRQIYQRGFELRKTLRYKRHISAFLSRLRWQAHFIQKFEMEHTMEAASVNKGYHKLKKKVSKSYRKAWEEGQTGFPLIDASMRCLQTTGYLNFRMRALLVSFFTHLLWQPWQEATTHLSQLFLDFEPGIHFPQLQMQAGVTGINNLRIYNPAKNGKEQDPEALFIKKWVPELAHLDIQSVHEPYLMTSLEQQFCNFKLGRDYPNPIIDIKEARKKASDILWSMKKDPDVQLENRRILSKHTLKDRNRMIQGD